MVVFLLGGVSYFRVWGSSNTVKQIFSDIVSEINSRGDGLYYISGSWTGHPNGYCAIIARLKYNDTEERKVIGLLFKWDDDSVYNCQASIASSGALGTIKEPVKL